MTGFIAFILCSGFAIGFLFAMVIVANQIEYDRLKREYERHVWY